MGITVNLDDQSLFPTVEVGDERPDGMLAAETRSQFRVSQSIP
jgi:hypothetical protein